MYREEAQMQEKVRDTRRGSRQNKRRRERWEGREGGRGGKRERELDGDEQDRFQARVHDKLCNVSLQTFKCHNKQGNDFAFLGSTSFLATAGHSSDGRYETAFYLYFDAEIDVCFVLVFTAKQKKELVRNRWLTQLLERSSKLFECLHLAMRNW